MKSARLVILAIALFLLAATGVQAEEKAAKAEKSPEELAQTAVFKVPDLDQGLSKQLVKSLTGVEGILAAKPDTETGTFAVTFATAKTDTDRIETALGEVAPQASLEKVGPADATAAKKDCSKCPKSAGCAKKKG
jgi:hypothetical protein